MSDIDAEDEDLPSIAREEALRCRRSDRTVDFADLARAVGGRLGGGFRMVPLSVLLDAKDAAEAKLH
jgi:hypothetical protein